MNNNGIPSLKQIVGEGNKAILIKVRKNHMYFHVLVPRFGTYQFTVPLEDRGDADWDSVMKAITLMKWIKKAIKNNEFVCVFGYINHSEEGF